MKRERKAGQEALTAAVVILLALGSVLLMYESGPLLASEVRSANGQESTILQGAMDGALGWMSGSLGGSAATASQGSVAVGSSSSSTGGNTQSVYGTQASSWLESDPSFNGTSAVVDFPPEYGVLANFTLGLINRDRAAAGLGPVSLSPITSGQQHADSMAYFGYFSHWDVQGYKPYMRYTLLGGNGSVTENIGLDYCTNSSPSSTYVVSVGCDTKTIENGIASSEWSMMNNDVACCNNGHRDDILNPLHNRVSVGIAYNAESKTLYFVEDFEDLYVNLGAPVLSGSQVTVTGAFLKSEPVSQVFVFYDAQPQPMTVKQLDSTSSYSPGTFAGGVVQPCTVYCKYYPGAVTVRASTWRVGAGSIDLSFSLGDFVRAYGAGVYTVYVDAGNNTNTAFVTYSVFVGAQG